MFFHTIEQGLATLTLSRPNKANALTETMLAAVADAVEQAAATDLRALILTGEGRVFSAGADLDEVARGLALSPQWARLSGLIAGLPCLTIAALNGTVAGGAHGMVLACDIRIAVPQARFFYPVMRLGYLPPSGDAGRMAALIGPARTRMILMAGQKIPAEQALQWGLIDEIAPPDGLMARARELAADALAADPAHVAAIKAQTTGGQAAG